MAISAPGIGSNLDINNIISQLMQVEQRPLLVNSQKEASFQGKISALGSLKSALSALESATGGLIPASGKTPSDKFITFKSTFSDAAVASATTTSTAATGTYVIEVSKLAQAQRLRSEPDPDIGTGVRELTISIGSESGGTFTLKPDSVAKTVTLDETVTTLEGVRDAINAAKAGVTASIVNGVDGKQLIIDSKSTGLDNKIKIEGDIPSLSFDYNPLTLGDLSEPTPAADTAATINGVAVSSGTHVVSTALEGISISLLKAPPDGETLRTTLTIAQDNSSLLSGLNVFIKAFNDVSKSVRDLSSFNPETKAAGLLNGDSTVRAVDSRLRSALFASPKADLTTFSRLADIGVTTNKDGTLTLDQAKVQKAIDQDFPAVAELAAAFGTAFKSTVSSLTSATGLVETRTTGLKDSVKLLGEQRQLIERRLEAIEQRYRKQFTALDTLVAGMTQTSNYLQQQLANLPGAGA